MSDSEAKEPRTGTPAIAPGETTVLPPEQSFGFKRPEEPPEFEGERCKHTWDFGGAIGEVRCSFPAYHDGHHYAAGDNPFNIYYRWDYIPGRVYNKRGSEADG